MIADRKSNPYFAPWRVDCRLARELPDDKPIRSHFIVQLAAALVCTVLILVAGWQYFRLQTVRNGIARWNRTMTEDRAVYDEVDRLRNSITADGRKIGDAAAALQSHILVFDFLSGLGRTRPDYLNIQHIQSTETGLLMQGTLEVSPERATRLLGKYVADLKADPHFGPHFSNIMLRGIDRRGDNTTAELQFEITFTYR